ncbi:MAG TPA: NAD(P)-dependent oxidoreductase [Vicinamibacterales bacterium]|nr:NAD(P)-dependent oxidoreductase [Vicinamibacterales bacterium]
MKVFVAGASGTIGIPLVRALVDAGHHVVALTRSPGKRSALEALGASAVVADALDRDALVAAVSAAQPTHVIHQLTALPREGPRRPSDIEPTNRLRVEGTANLLHATIGVRARRFIVGSFAPLAGMGSASTQGAAAAAVRSMERQVIEAAREGLIEGVVLRYGMFYGPGVPSTAALVDMVRRRRLPVVRKDTGQLPLIHIDDAVNATVLALERATAGATYDIVDDYPASMTEIVTTLAKYAGSSAPFRVPAWLPRLVAPYLARMTAMRMPLSNARAKAELGWEPKYPTIQQGLAEMFRRAA